MEEEAELDGEMIVLNPLLLFDLDGLFVYDGCVTNFGCEPTEARHLVRLRKH